MTYYPWQLLVFLIFTFLMNMISEIKNVEAAFAIVQKGFGRFDGDH